MAVQDARVTAAAAHWAHRFVANGTDYADFAATLARITRWDDWCEQWAVTARRYEDLAATAEQSSSPVTASGAWYRAALSWHWGKFVFVDDPVQQRAAHDRTVACFAKCAGALSPPAERVEIPYEGTRLPGYLRVPPVLPAKTTVPATVTSPVKPPVVIMVPGLDSTKEELQATAGYFLARGLAALAVDGPGQGESEYELAIEPAYEKVASAVVDYLATRPDVDNSKIGLFGVSLGGYYAARAAAFEERIAATVALSGPYEFDRDWDDLPPMTRATFRVRSHAADDDDARRKAGELTLAGAAPRITRPLLVVAGGRDQIIPASHASRLAAEAPAAELALYPDGGHGVTNFAYESRSKMADWLAARLDAGPAAPAAGHPAVGLPVGPAAAPPATPDSGPHPADLER